MKNVLTRLSKSTYIQELLEQTITDVFANDELLNQMTQDLALELQSLDLNKGYLSADEEEQLKHTTGGFLGDLTKKIINLTYEKFITQHAENVNVVILKTKTKHLLHIFLYNLKNSPGSCQEPKQQQLYESLSNLMEKKMEAYTFLALTPLPEYVISEVQMILLEDEKSVCYKSTKISDIVETQSLLKNILLDPEVSHALAQFLSFSLETEEGQEASILPIHQGFVKSAYENMYSAQTLYGEQNLEKLKKFLELGYVEYERQEVHKTPQEFLHMVKWAPLSFEELHNLLKHNRFNPKALVAALLQ